MKLSRHFLISTLCFVGLNLMGAKAITPYMNQKYVEKTQQLRSQLVDSVGETLMVKEGSNGSTFNQYSNHFTVQNKIFGILAVQEQVPTVTELSVYVLKKSGQNWKVIQKLQMDEVAFPIPIKILHFQKQLIISVTYNGPKEYIRYFQFDSKLERLKESSELDDLGRISAVDEKSDYFYGYRTCGCADGCWISVLANWSHDKIIPIARKGCDCDRAFFEDFSISKEKKYLGPCESKSDNFTEILRKDWLKFKSNLPEH